jgi:hypothetical protein
MNWNLRYAASQQVFNDLKAVLPEGWEVKGVRRAEEGEWYGRRRPMLIKDMPPGDPGDMDNPKNWNKPRIDRYLNHPDYDPAEERIKHPEAIDCHNPLTGNTMTILSHAPMHSSKLPTDNPLSRAYVWERDYYNPISHGNLINKTLSQVDKLRKGVHTDFTQEPGTIYYGRGVAQARSKSQMPGAPSDLIEHFAPEPTDITDRTRPVYKDWASRYKATDENSVTPEAINIDVTAGITHEIGHLHHNDDYSNRMRTYLSTLIDHHNSLSDDAVNRDRALKLFDKHVTKNNDIGSQYENLTTSGRGKLSSILSKVLKTTAPMETYTAINQEKTGSDYNYYARHLNESYAEHFAAFHNPQKTYANNDLTHRIAQDVGQKLGWGGMSRSQKKI